MFTFARPGPAEIDRTIEQYSALNLQPVLLHTRRGLRVSQLPSRFVHGVSRSRIGKGPGVFQAAVQHFEAWNQFDLGWVRVANTGAHITMGEIVAVEVHALGLWSLNLSQIVDVIQDTSSFGFIYKTTSRHAEEGEERFLLTFDPSTQDVCYELEAVSRPQHWLAKVGYPATRAFQRRFARDSHRRIREAVSGTEA